MLVKVGERIKWTLKEKKSQEVTARRLYPGRKDKEHVCDVAMVSSPNANQASFPKQSNVPWRNPK